VIVGAAHPGCTVSNLERSLRFYGETLGIEHIKSQVSDQPYLALVTGLPGCSLKIGFARIEGDHIPFEIIEHIKPAGGRALTGFGIAGTPHVCWQVDNVAAICQRLSGAGITLCAEPHGWVDGPWSEAHGAFVRDPDGLLIELIEFPKRQEETGHLVRFHHFGLTVSDLSKATDFFCKKLGMEEIARYEGDSAYIRHHAKLKDNYICGAALLVPQTDLYIELWQFRTPIGLPARVANNNPGTAHLCFLVDSIMADYAALREQGIQFVGPPAEVTAGVNQGAWAIYFVGPDNTPFELFQKPALPVG
jgi:catechol 2,3-dioxygenase-like lactoylglutathione lyase family enzyme